MSIRYLQISLNTPNPPPPSTPAPPKKIKIKKLVFLLGISVDQREIEEILLGGEGGVGTKKWSYWRCANAKFSDNIPFC